MILKHLIFIALVIALLLAAGCTKTTNQTISISSTTNQTISPSSVTTITEKTLTIAPVTSASTQSWTCVGKGNFYSMEPLTPIIYKQSDPNTPVYQSLPPPQPTPSYTGAKMQNDPIIGTYIFDPSQFKSSDVENLEYFSTLSSSEFYYVVPLDISPDIKWTFRDDGVLLFFQNNIISNDNSLRRFWRNSSGYFLRSGTWQRLESENNKNIYQITWGCFGQPQHNYRVTYDNTGVHLIQPNILNMTKVG